VAARDRRRADIAKFIETVNAMRVTADSPNEQAIWVILAHHGTKDGATHACKALWDRYVSVNEFRVAKVTEIADLIEKHVKNDPIAAAEQARGYLRKYFKEWQTVDPSATEGQTPDQIKKYLASLDAFQREIALALALYYTRAEIDEAAPVESENGDAPKDKKRPEKDVTAAANRLRLLFAYSAYGNATAKTLQTNASRAFLKSWAYKPLPKPQPPKPTPKKKAPAKPVATTPAKKVAKKAPSKKTPAKKAPAKKTPAKKAAKKAVAKKTAKKAPAKKAAKKTAANRAAGKARPKTARKVAKRTTKKSSRR
jgi:hypothetical protein